MLHVNNASQNLWALLQRAADLWPKNGLTLRENGPSGPASTFSYGVVKAGQPVLLYFDNHEQNIIWTWSAIAAGCIPAILPPFSNDENTLRGQLENLKQLFGTPVVLTSRSDQSRFQQSSSFRLYFAEDLQNQHAYVSSIASPDFHPDSVAVLLFTSGSTGPPKAVEFRHRQLILSAQAKQQLHGTSCETNFMTWVSFDHSVNFAETHINAMNTGSSQILIRAMDVMGDPVRFYELLSEDRIGYTFSPNAFLSRATKELKARSEPPILDLAALNTIIVGGEATHALTLWEANQTMASYGAKGKPVKAVYGLSETCSACFYNYEPPQYDMARKNQFASVGKPMRTGVEIRIASSASNSGSSEGAIQLRGPVVFNGYYNNPGATNSSMTADGWFDTGDLGRLDENGNLEILGRSKEILVINGNKYAAFALEDAIEARVPARITPSYTAAFNAWDPRSGSEGFVVLFNPADDKFDDGQAVQDTITFICQACVAFCSTAPLDVVPLPRDSMPKSSIGKLSRQRLRKHYVEGVFDEYKVSDGVQQPGSQLTSPLGIQIAKSIARETGIPAETMTTATPIIHTGLDSISYMRIRQDIESFLSLPDQMPLKVLFEASNVGDLEKSLSAHGSLTDSWLQYKPCVTLRGNGSKAPLFCFHGGDGEVTHFLPLLTYLPDRPIYVFQPKGRNPGEGHFASIDELVACYYVALREIQPHGPYALLGYCLGSLVAFELGSRLEADGHQVAFCGGIDSPPNVLEMTTNNGNVKDFAVDLLMFLGFMGEEQSHHCHKMLSNAPDDMDVVYQILRQNFQSGKSDWSWLTPAKMETWRTLFCGLLEIAKAHQVQGHVSRYDCFYAPPMDQTLEEWERKIWRWEQLATTATFWKTQGHHFSVLKEPNIKTFQACLNEAFWQAGI